MKAYQPRLRRRRQDLPYLLCRLLPLSCPSLRPLALPTTSAFSGYIGQYIRLLPLCTTSFGYIASLPPTAHIGNTTVPLKHLQPPLVRRCDNVNSSLSPLFRNFFHCPHKNLRNPPSTTRLHPKDHVAANSHSPTLRPSTVLECLPDIQLQQQLKPSLALSPVHSASLVAHHARIPATAFLRLPQPAAATTSPATAAAAPHAAPETSQLRVPAQQARSWPDAKRDYSIPQLSSTAGRGRKARVDTSRHERY